MIYLKEKSPNVYYVWGSFDYIKYVTKTVTVDGEQYSNTKGEFVRKEISESDYSDLDNCAKYEFDMLNEFGIPTIVVYCFNGFHPLEMLKKLRSNKQQEWHSHSENGYVNCFYHLWQFIKPDSWLGIINAQRERINMFHKAESVNKFQSSVIEYPILSWGFNNEYTILLYAHEIVKYDHKKIYNNLPYHVQYSNEHFKILAKKMNDDEKLSFAIREIDKLSNLIDAYNKMNDYKNQLDDDDDD